MKIILVAGARPNFIKLAPLTWELERRKKDLKSQKVEYLIVHTGQHYDIKMSHVFFEDLNLPHPDINLNVGSASHSVQTANIMINFEEVCIKEKADLVIVVGDVNSTIACTLVASKLEIKTAHIEAGLRSFDRTMPEEINRILTDSISDYLFTTCMDANNNLKREGIAKEKVFFVGNIMIDSLKRYQAKAKIIDTKKKYGLEKSRYALLTLHRPSNVDEKDSLEEILKAIKEISRHIPIYFPIHPRTEKNINKYKLKKLLDDKNSIIITDPLGYLEFISLMMDSKFVLTDSGGIQEETTALGIPCLTLRNNTERPITVKEGTNLIVGNCKEEIIQESLRIMNGNGKNGRKNRVPKLWDGNTAERIVDVLIKKLSL